MSVVTGNHPHIASHHVLQPGRILYAGTQCNDGRPITESFHYKQAKRMGIPIVLFENPVYGDGIAFVDKYAPKTIQDIIGNKEQIHTLGKWLDEFNKDHKALKAVLLTGPPGIGKTTMAHLVATTLGYHVAEYNASDTRTAASFAGLGQRRLRNEVVIIDEIDGLSERGSIGAIAELIRTSQIPIICIANDKPPKLKPILSVTLDIKCVRPMKSTIAIALAKKIPGTTKEQIERLCEANGNDIRSVLNTLDFIGGGLKDSLESTKDPYGSTTKDALEATTKDPQHDIFSATYKLMRNKRATFAVSDDLVFTDYNMVPLMVQEAYPSSAADIDELEAAAERLSFGDLISKQAQTVWSLLPHVVSNTTAVTKMVSGPAPSQIFPQLLGKESKRTKHRGWCKELAYRLGIPPKKMRLDYMGSIHTLFMNWLLVTSPKAAVKNMTELGVIREDLDTIQDLSMEKTEIPAKTKAAVTREFTKLLGKKRKVDAMEEEEVEELEVDFEALEI